MEQETVQGDFAHDEMLERACRLAQAGGLELREGPEGLTLTDGTMELRADFSQLLPRVRPDRLAHELLVRAARLKGEGVPRVFDATAGLGEDSFLLAAAGCEVTLCEANPVICALLCDGLARAALDERLAPIVARMHPLWADSVSMLQRLAGSAGEAPDVVYLDPMFPARQKSAAVKKKFQLLHHLESPCANEEDLMRAALGVHPRKVVVKRPPRAPWLAGVKPSHAVEGKAVRYDCIVPAQLKRDVLG